MQKFYLINKKIGETPLEALEVFRNKKKIDPQVPMTYAGRLDPMASGLLLILVGEECKNKEKYLGLDKEYEFQVLFGFSTDTYDILGKVTKVSPLQFFLKEDLEKLIKKILKNFKGKIIQKYPIYSSKTVDGKPLFTYARSEKDVEIPEREVNIKSLKFLNLKKVSSQKILKDIEGRIAKVKGDFRQKDILKIWQKNLKKKNNFYIGYFKVRCSSGTYVRSIANTLGENIIMPTLAFNIKRVKVGKFKL
ncbi:MAG: hypothetical protein KBD14_00630 [Candidatus Pacebacteria bacterium]|nr:hypothetical protein [Candidatus Paceibacterota bacterium]